MFLFCLNKCTSVLNDKHIVIPKDFFFEDFNILLLFMPVHICWHPVLCMRVHVQI